MSLPCPAPPQASAEATTLPTARTEPDWQASFAQLSALHEEQRRQAARTVHDRIAQALAAIKMSAYLCLVEDDPQQVRRELEQIKALAAQTAHEVRSLEQSLRPAQLDSVGLESALRAETERRFDHATGVALELQIQPLPQPPSPEVAIGCIRILQCLFDAICAQSAPTRLAVLLHDSDESCFIVQIRSAWQETQDGHRWPDVARFPLAQAMAICLGGALSTAEGGAEQTLHLLLPYRHPDPGGVAG